MFNIIPSYDMNFKEKLITLAKLILFISLILSLIFRSIAYILFGFILILFLYYIYLYNQESKKKFREELNIKDRDYIDNNYCVKPNKDNPFMNPNILNNNYNYNIKACNIDNIKIKKEMNNYFKTPIYKDVIDIYEKKFSDRQFYTMPSTTIPNDQEAFSKWLYTRQKTCKENSGNQCLNNIM